MGTLSRADITAVAIDMEALSPLTPLVGPYELDVDVFIGDVLAEELLYQS